MPHKHPGVRFYRDSGSDTTRRFLPALSTARHRYTHALFTFTDVLVSTNRRQTGRSGPSLFEFRGVVLHPPQNGRVCQTNAALHHHHARSRQLSLKLNYQHTHNTTIYWSKCRPLNQLFHPIHPAICSSSRSHYKFAPEPADGRGADERYQRRRNFAFLFRDTVIRAV
jgi:hypothetical protein